jgi:cell division protein FtsW
VYERKDGGGKGVKSRIVRPIENRREDKERARIRAKLKENERLYQRTTNVPQQRHADVSQRYTGAMRRSDSRYGSTYATPRGATRTQWQQEQLQRQARLARQAQRQEERAQEKLRQQQRQRQQKLLQQRAKQKRKKWKDALFAKADDTTYFDYNLFLSILFLTAFGLVVLYSASAYNALSDYGDDMAYFRKQLLFSVGGFVVMYVASRLDYHIYAGFALPIYVVAIGLMVLVQTPLGVEVNGARRWLALPGGLRFQPSEVMKIGLILYVSYILCEEDRTITMRESMLKVGALVLGAAAAVYVLTENLSTAIIVGSIGVILYFIAHPLIKPFLWILAGGATVVSVALAGVLSLMQGSGSFRLDRIMVWLDPVKYSDEGGFQVLQGMYAIGSGGFFGKGLGNSIQKIQVIPEAQNDMIFTILCEELGVFGGILVLILFGMMLYRLMFVARNAPDRFGFYVASGIFAHIALQVILNIAVVTNLIPTTGITLPFISYGGTSVVFLMIEMGIALGISRKIPISDVNPG